VLTYSQPATSNSRRRELLGGAPILKLSQLWLSPKRLVLGKAYDHKLLALEI